MTNIGLPGRNDEALAPYNEQQFAQMRDERKEKIVEAGLKVFARKGIAGTKITMIAAEAGISNGLLYHYFKSKDEFLHHIFHIAVQDADSMHREIRNTSGTPVDKFKHFTITAFTESNTDVILLIQQALRSDEIPEPSLHLIRQASEGYFEHFLPIFKEGQERGDFYPGDPKELLDLYLSMISGLMAEGIRWPKEELDRNVDVLLRLIVVPSRLPSRDRE